MAKLATKAASATVLRLVTTPAVADGVDPLLVTAAQDILRWARSGELTGLAVVVMRRGENFFVDALGHAVASPWAARGCVAALDDLLRKECERQDT